MKALWNWQRNCMINRASHARKQRHRENVPADTPLSVLEEGDVQTIHALMAQDRYVAQQAYITLKQLVHLTPEIIAVRGVHRRHAWKSAWTTKWSGSLESNMGNGESRRETRRIQQFKKSTSTYIPARAFAVIVLMVIYYYLYCRQPRQNAPSAQRVVSRTICALQWQLSACRDWPWCTSTRTHSSW